jgi:hypothetical protein
MGFKRQNGNKDSFLLMVDSVMHNSVCAASEAGRQVRAFLKNYGFHNFLVSKPKPDRGFAGLQELGRRDSHC